MKDGIYDIDLNEVFKEKEPAKFLFADWLTDTIYFLKGKILAEGLRPVQCKLIDLYSKT